MRVADCRVQDTREALASLPKGEIFAMMDIAPELLLVSDHTVLATGHHRGDKAMKVLIETALGTPEEARDTLRGRGTAYVAMCPSLNEPRTYAQMAPEGFAAQLADGNAPQWLEPVAMPADAGLKFWRVTPE